MNLDKPSASPGGLPEIIPLFPLEGTLLLPRGHLPLHVFEPRYRAMVEWGLGHGRVIGMIQPKSSHEFPTPDEADLFDVGCAGRIVSFAETEDGRFLITLRGMCRFRRIEELPLLEGFRRVRTDYAPFATDLDPPVDAGVDRDRLLAAARGYLTLKNIESDWSAIESASIPALVTSFAMICPFEPGEKQALLETPTLAEQGWMLISLFEMALLESEAAQGSTRH